VVVNFENLVENYLILVGIWVCSNLVLKSYIKVKNSQTLEQQWVLS
jgi:hypothetical protein